MADEDNFDIDIYGDGEGMDEDSKAFYKQENEKNLALKEEAKKEQQAQAANGLKTEVDTDQESGADESSTIQQAKREISEEETKPSMQQGVKRKGESDERRIDAGATNALMVSDLHWWTTEDDIRGWMNDADAEDELKDITFSEHKVNGKSKGQAFLEFISPQASTATKHMIESLTSGPAHTRKFSVVFTSVSPNPFKTLPKDAPARGKEDRSQRSASTHSGMSHQNEYVSNRGYRGGRGGGFNNRGNYNQGGFNSNRNFSGPMGGGFNNTPNFQSNMPMMNNFNNFNNRGGMMGNNMRGNMGGMRGGRGGMGGNMMGMAMNPMMAGMGMNPMMVGGMGTQGFAGAQFNPSMFNQGGGAQGMNSGDWGHGAKRQRQD